MKQRERIGIVLDYGIRIPQFKETYLKFKEQVLVGMTAGQHLDQADIIDENSYWAKAIKADPTIADFYAKQPIPASNYGDDFDITLKKYFMNNEHRLKFIEEWSFALYGQGAPTNKADITVINTAQSKLCDIVLIDRTTNARKIPNTFAFLSRSGVFVKEVVFTNTEDEIEAVKKTCIAVWDPFKDPKQILTPGAKFGQPTEKFVEWFIEQEKLINK